MAHFYKRRHLVDQSRHIGDVRLSVGAGEDVASYLYYYTHIVFSVYRTKLRKIGETTAPVGRFHGGVQGIGGRNRDIGESPVYIVLVGMELPETFVGNRARQFRDRKPEVEYVAEADVHTAGFFAHSLSRPGLFERPCKRPGGGKGFVGGKKIDLPVIVTFLRGKRYDIFRRIGFFKSESSGSEANTSFSTAQRKESVFRFSTSDAETAET